MNNDKEKLLGYKPSFIFLDEYTSELNSQDDSDIEEVPSIEDEGKEQIDNLIEDMEKLDNLINKLPNNVSDIVKEVYDQVLDFTKDELEDKIVLPVPEEEQWDYSDEELPSDNDKEDKDPNYDDMWSTDDFFPIEKETHTQEEIIEKEYIKNLVDLLEDYNTGLHNIISNFWTNLILATNNKNASEIKMLLDNIVLSSSNIRLDAKHLLDSAVRSQIVKDMKLNYYNMMFNAEESIKHLKQLKAMKELRLRYAKIKEVEGNTKTNQMNNNVLIASKLTYDRKYDIAYENLYRYLNSSNKVLEKTLQSWIQEIKSKQILIERQGIL